MHFMFKKIVLILLVLSTQLFSEESYLIEKKVSFSNASSLTQVTKNTLIPTPNASPSTIPDLTSQIMKLHGQLLLSNGLLIDSTFANAKTFLDSCVGMISAFASATPPPGWLLCDGTEYSTTANCEFQNLADAIRNNWGGSGSYLSGHYSGKFKVPDLRGLFLRGADSMHANISGQPDGLNTAGIDTDQRYPTKALDTAGTTPNVGSYQDDTFVSHGASHILSGSTTSDSNVHSHTVSNITGTAFNNFHFWDTDPPDRHGWVRSNRSATTESETSENSHTHQVTLSGKLTAVGTTNKDTTSHPKNYAVVYGIRF